MATRKQKTPKRKPAGGNGQAPATGAISAARARFLKSSVRVIAGAQGRSGRPFSFESAIAEFGSWAYAAIVLNATAVSSTPLRLYTRKRSGRKLWRTAPVPRRRKAYLLGEASGALGRVMPERRVLQKMVELGDDFEEVTEPHPVTDLIARVNPWFNGYDLVQLLVIYLELTGNAYWHTIGDRLGIAEIWPMPSQWTWVEEDAAKYVSAYLYGRGGHQQQRFAPDEIIHFRTASPSKEGLWYGMGKMEAAWAVISLNSSQHAMDLSMADNNARPDYVMVVKSGATTDALNRFEAAVERKLRGKGKQGRMLSITGEVDLKALNWPPKDLAGREEVVEEISAIIGTPVSLLKANDPNLASARVGYAQWRETTVLPITKLIEQKLNERLLPMFGIEDDAVLAFDNPVPEDEQLLTDKVTKLKGARIITLNEARDELGLPHMEGGDEIEEPMPTPFGGGPPQPGAAKPASATQDQKAIQYVNPLVPVLPALGCVEANTINLLRTGASLDYAIMRAKEICAGEPAATGPNRPGAGSSGGGGGGGAEPNVGGTPSTLAIKVSELWLKATDVPADAASASDEASIRKVLADLIAQVRRRIEKGETPEQLAAFMQDVAWQQRLKEAVSPMLLESIEAGVKTGAAQLGMTGFDVHNPDVQAFVGKWQTRLTGTVLRNLTVPMTDLLGEGIAQGESVAMLSQRVRDWAALEDPERGLAYRAERIARTESARAYVEGELETWRASGQVIGKEWLLAPDACEFCQAVAKEYAERPLGLDGLYYQRGHTLTGASGKTMLLDYSDVNGPPLHPGCRCDLLPVLSDD